MHAGKGYTGPSFAAVLAAMLPPREATCERGTRPVVSASLPPLRLLQQLLSAHMPEQRVDKGSDTS